MTFTITFRSQAQREITEAVDWYESQHAGLGAEFFRTVEATVATIRRNPYQFQIAQREVRRAVMRRFPYSIMYRVREADIVIVACFHGSRDPRRWTERI
jgi:plasmid stabilization system protein ParE